MASVCKLAKYTLLLLLLITSQIGFSQEINCRIQVNSSQIQGTDKSVFEELQKSLYEFVNNYKSAIEENKSVIIEISSDKNENFNLHKNFYNKIIESLEN